MAVEEIGGPAQTLAPERVDAFVREALGADDYTGRSVCVLVPDATRSCPLPLLLDAVHGALAGRVARLTVLVALGTHAGLAEPELAALVGRSPAASPTGTRG
jgi:nickel-dependent lactate racemase